MKRFIVLTLFLASVGAHAECPRSLPTERPDIPDGKTATADSMLQAQKSTASYVHNIEDYLSCWQPMLTNSNHNRLVNKAMAAATAYNRELKRFRQREELAAR